MLLNILGASLSLVFLLFIRLVSQVLGLPIVAVALLFAKEHPTTRVPSWKDWRLIRLPLWAWPWDNIRDGALGDIRGRYRFDQAPKWACTDYLRAFNWLAIRNPANNLSRWTPFLSVNLIGRTIKVLSEGPRHRFLRVIGKYGIPYWHLCFKIKDGLFLNAGHKLKLKNNTEDWTGDEQKARKGFTIRFDSAFYE